MLASKKDNHNSGEEELSSVADVERGASPTDGSGCAAEMETSVESERVQRRRILHRVPPQVRKNTKHIYDPVAVSIGPYYHGQPRLRRFEKFKDEVFNIMLNSDGGTKDKGLLFRGKILERIDEIRSFYDGLSTNEYDDEALVKMMLRDACLVLYYMEITVGNQKRYKHGIQSVGLFGLSLMWCDHCRLENQIPWWVIKFLISLTYDDDEGAALICKYFSNENFGDSRLKRVPWEEGTEEEPLHLLEGIRTTSLKVEISSTTDRFKEDSMFRWSNRRTKSSQIGLYELVKRPFLSATELKAKGIYFKRSSEFLNDIRFSSYAFCGVLHLPALVVDAKTITFFSNLIALEMSPGPTNSDIEVISYVNFMKTLIENAKDVKLLQEKGILTRYLEDNEQIIRIFKDINTHGLDNFSIFHDIRRRIDEHCDSKAKTWIAELINTYFRTPWTAIALFAAILLLCLTLLQTYYTLNPMKNGN